MHLNPIAFFESSDSSLIVVGTFPEPNGETTQQSQDVRSPVYELARDQARHSSTRRANRLGE